MPGRCCSLPTLRARVPHPCGLRECSRSPAARRRPARLSTIGYPSIFTVPSSGTRPASTRMTSTAPEPTTPVSPRIRRRANRGRSAALRVACAGLRRRAPASRRTRAAHRFFGRAPENRFDQHVARHLVAVDEAGVAAVAQDRRAIGDAHDFFEPVGDEKDAVIGVAQPFEQREQPIGSRDSSDAVGSSRIRKVASTASARAISVNFFSAASRSRTLRWGQARCPGGRAGRALRRRIAPERRTRRVAAAGAAFR